MHTLGALLSSTLSQFCCICSSNLLWCKSTLHRWQRIKGSLRKKTSTSKPPFFRLCCRSHRFRTQRRHCRSCPCETMCFQSSSAVLYDVVKLVMGNHVDSSSSVEQLRHGKVIFFNQVPSSPLFLAFSIFSHAFFASAVELVRRRTFMSSVGPGSRPCRKRCGL